MTAERSAAYGRIMHTLHDIGPTKLQPVEQERIRDAADTLLFTEDTAPARAVLHDIEELTEHLVATDRWTSQRAAELLDDLGACGPLTAVSLR